MTGILLTMAVLLLGLAFSAVVIVVVVSISFVHGWLHRTQARGAGIRVLLGGRNGWEYIPEEDLRDGSPLQRH